MYNTCKRKDIHLRMPFFPASVQASAV